MSLGVVVAASVLARVAYVLTVGRHVKLGFDAIWYMFVAGNIASGHGYSNPSLLFFHNVERPTAYFPPGYPVFLAGLHELHLTTATAVQLAGSVCGGVTVLATGLLARKLTGRASVGLVAAALVGASPALIASDASVMAETLAVPVTALLLLAACWAATGRSVLRWVTVGALGGLLALVRSEDVLVPALLVPTAVIAAPRIDARRRVVLVGAVLAAAACVMSPWVIRNTQSFNPPIPLSTNGDKTLAGANCSLTYGGPRIGYYDDACSGHVSLATSDEGKYAAHLQADGLHYARTHASRLPLVVAIRVLRGWGLYAPLQSAGFAAAETRSVGWQLVAWPCTLGLLVLGLAGITLLRKDRLALALLGGPVVIDSVVLAASYGNPRFVLTSLPALAIGSAATIVRVADRLGMRRRARPRPGSARTAGARARSSNALVSPGMTSDETVEASAGVPLS